MPSSKFQNQYLYDIDIGQQPMVLEIDSMVLEIDNIRLWYQQYLSKSTANNGNILNNITGLTTYTIPQNQTHYSRNALAY